MGDNLIGLCLHHLYCEEASLEVEQGTRNDGMIQHDFVFTTASI